MPESRNSVFERVLRQLTGWRRHEAREMAGSIEILHAVRALTRDVRSNRTGQTGKV